jgi:AsmA protein
MATLNRSFKLILIVIAVLLLALLAFVATFDANNYKPEIIEQVEKATGRDFTIDGEINLSIFPWVGLKVEDVALGNEKGFQAAQFAAIKQLDIRVNVLPLLKKEVEINTIRLHGLDVSLEVAEDKSNNWSGLSATDDASAESVEKEDVKEVDVDQAVSDSETGSPLQSLKVEGFEFVDATIRYADRSSETSATISDLNLKTGAIQFGKPVNVEFGARIESNQPVIDARLNLTTQLIFNQEFTEISLLDFVTTILVSANEMFQQDETFEIKTTINVLMDEQRVTLKQLQLSALGTTTVADINVSQFLKTPLIQGTIDVQPFNVREVAKRAGVELPVMAKETALTNVGVKTVVKLQGERIEANDFSLMLDESTLSGWLHVIDLTKQQLRYDLVLSQINVNDYLPPAVAESQVSDEAAPSEPSEVVGQAASGDEKIELPVEMMREMDIKGDLRVASLTVKDYSIQQLLMSTNAQKGKVAIDPLSMNLLDGGLTSAVVVDVRKEKPTYLFDLSVDQVQMGPVANPFLKGAMGEKELTMKGAADVVVDIKAAGDTINQLKKSALGKIVLDMKKTEVNGFDPEFYMRSSVAEYMKSKGFGLSKTIMGDYEPREVTVFDLIHGTIDLSKGIARTDDFIMDSKRVKVGAKGHTDIVKDTMDITSSVKLARSKTAIEKVLDSPLFVRVHGPLDALQYDLDTDRLKKSTTDVLEKEAKAAAEKKVKKELKKETKRLEKKIMDKFKGFF